MVANTDLVVLRALKLNAQVADLVISGKRDAEAVANILQAVKDGRKLEFAGAVSCFPIWKTITLGTGFKTADDFRRALKVGGYRINDWANDILDGPAFKAANQETEVNLVRVSVAELGFPNGATRQEIYNRAQKFGLDLCPPEVGPQLRLQYKDQPMGEWLVIGMNLAGSGGSLGVFGVYRGGDVLWLGSGGCGDPGGFWFGSHRWVFRRK